MLLLLNLYGNISLNMQTSLMCVEKVEQGISRDIHVFAFLTVYYQFRLHSFSTVAWKDAMSFMSKNKQAVRCLAPFIS